MKTLIWIGVVVLALMVATSCFAATPQTKTTNVSVSVNEVFSLAFGVKGTGEGQIDVRSDGGAITFRSVDGSADWYYNSLATLDAIDKNKTVDGKSDLGLICKSNAHGVGMPFYVKIKKNSDTLNGYVGYGVGGAYDAGADTETPITSADGTVSYPSGFKASTGTGKNGWGAIGTSDTTIFTSAGNRTFASYGILIPLSFALVPDGLAKGTHSTVITYTMTTTA